MKFIIHYCKRGTVTFNSSQVDRQCTGNRGGILCGNCTNGHSITLGSNKCKNCTDDGCIALVVVFAVRSWYCFSSITNSSQLDCISRHYQWTHILCQHCEPFFFMNGDVSVLSLFISWLNLDFSIETCFFNGLTPVIKVWLQLQIVFPHHYNYHYNSQPFLREGGQIDGQ